LNIMDSFSEKNLYKPFIAFINPTDFLVADNILEVLGDRRIVEVLNKFKRLSFQSTYLNISKAEEIAKVLKEHYSTMELEFNILIEPDKVNNIKYLGVLGDNQKAVEAIMDWPIPIRKFGIMNVFDYNTTKIAELLKDYDYLHKRVEHLFDTTIDFNFSLGRKDTKLSPEEFYKAANDIKTMFNDSVVTDHKAEYLRFSFGRLSDSLVEKQYNWKNGEFYYSPLLYERYISFIPDLLMPIKEYTSKEFETYEETIQLDQYMNVGNKDECEDCPILGSCVDRGILHLMDIHEITECLVAKNAMHVVNAMGTLPYGSN